MTATTIVSTAARNRRIAVTVGLVVAAHAAVLALLATMKPIEFKRIEPPKPIEVKFVHLAPPPPPPPPKPKPEPKKPEPKEVKVVQPVPKPQPKPQPVIATKAVATQPQVVVPVQPDPPPVPVPVPAPAPAPQPPKPAVKPDIVQPKLVSSQQVSYIRQPKFDFDNEDLKNKSRSIKLKLNVGADGKVENVEIVHSTGIAVLDSRLQKAWQKAVFTPYKENGVAIPTYQFQEFTLDLVNE